MPTIPPPDPAEARSPATTRIPVHTIADAPAAAGGLLGAISRRTGGTLNIHAEMAHAPAVLAGYAGLQEAIARHGSFPASVREAVALAVSAVDGCDCCQAAHTRSGRAGGLTDAEMIAIRRGDGSGDDKLDALLAVARVTAQRVGDVDHTTWQAALRAGWTTTQLTELFVHVAANLYTNYFNHYAGTSLDLPAAPALDQDGASGTGGIAPGPDRTDDVRS